MPACPECGYDYDSLSRDQILQALVLLAEQHQAGLAAVPAEQLRGHPRPGWSALEYGCHVRDMLRVQRDRVALAQVSQTPAFTSMRRDERAVDERYNDQDPSVVAGEIISEARLLASALGALDEEGWLRTGIYPWPEPELRTVQWIGRRTAHELAHHLFDQRRLLG
jgi:DinB superfamily